MAANTPTCPKCGGPLAPVSNKPGRWACIACGLGFGVRDRKADAPAPAGGDPRLRTALLVASGGAVVLLGLIAAVAFVVVHPAGGAASPKPVAAAPSTPAPDPAPDPRPTLPPAPDPISTPPPPTTVSAPPTTPDPAVNKAIDKGVAYLKTAVNRVPLGPVTNGGSGGGTGIFSLVGLALLESGVPADDPAVVKAVAAARSSGAAANSTYEIATCLWLLNRVGDRRDDGLMRDLATRLLAGQNQFGAWDYLCPIVAPAKQKELLSVLNAYDPSKEIPAAQQLVPACAYRRGMSLQTDAGDNSVTQFAVLGLWVARKHQVPVDRSLLMAEAHARATQKDEGGWAYRPGGIATDAMTCAGLMELSVGRGVSEMEGGKTRQADPQFEKGIWFLSDIYDRGGAAAAVKASLGDAYAAYATLEPLAADLLGHVLQGQRAAWKKDLAAFQAELERCLAADPPADAKKDLQQIEDQIKQYHDAPGDKVTQEKAVLVKQIQQSAAGRAAAAAAAAAGPGMAPGRPYNLLLPNRDQGTNLDDIYALWSLERLAMVCDLKTLAGHDWYAWGADLLVTHQRDDGGWAGPGNVPEPVDACLALLFLKRVNVAQDLTAQLRRIAPVQDLTAEQLHYTSAGQFRLLGPTAPSKPSGP